MLPDLEGYERFELGINYLTNQHTYPSRYHPFFCILYIFVYFEFFLSLFSHQKMIHLLPEEPLKASGNGEAADLREFGLENFLII